MLIGFDYYNEDNACLQDGILKQLRKRKMQRFFRRQGDMVQETDDSHVEYVVQYRFIQLSPTVQIYFRHLMEQAYRDVDMNLMSVKLINPYELVQAVDDLFQYVRDYSDEPVPSETEPLILLLNSHLDGKGPFGFSTEFTYRELQKMIDEIFRKDSEFAIRFRWKTPLRCLLPRNRLSPSPSTSTGVSPPTAGVLLATSRFRLLRQWRNATPAAPSPSSATPIPPRNVAVSSSA